MDPLPQINKHSESISASYEDVLKKTEESSETALNPSFIETKNDAVAPLDTEIALDSSKCSEISTAPLVTDPVEGPRPCESTLSSAPPLNASSLFDEIIHEFKLPQCYTVDELKNFYSNQSVDRIDLLENVFLEVGLHYLNIIELAF